MTNGRAKAAVCMRRQATHRPLASRGQKGTGLACLLSSPHPHLHVFNRVHGHARHAHITRHPWVVRVVAARPSSQRHGSRLAWGALPPHRSLHAGTPTAAPRANHSRPRAAIRAGRSRAWACMAHPRCVGRSNATLTPCCPAARPFCTGVAQRAGRRTLCWPHSGAASRVRPGNCF